MKYILSIDQTFNTSILDTTTLLNFWIRQPDRFITHFGQAWYFSNDMSILKIAVDNSTNSQYTSLFYSFLFWPWKLGWQGSRAISELFIGNRKRHNMLVNDWSTNISYNPHVIICLNWHLSQTDTYISFNRVKHCPRDNINT